MISKKRLKMDLKKTIFGCFFVIMGVFGGVIMPIVHSTNVSAVPDTTEEQEEDANTSAEDESRNTTTVTNTTGDECQNSLGSIGWLVCPATGKIAEAVDWLYDKLEDILNIKPVSAEDGSPIYEIWKYFLGITNIVFIIFLLVVIYSQITGIGITNYGIKKILPKLIITAVLVNLSFFICSLAVDVSNIVGNGLRGVFTGIEESVIASSAGDASSATSAASDLTREAKLSYVGTYSTLAGGTGLAVAAGLMELYGC